jgi:hypothetical protein
VGGPGRGWNDNARIRQESDLPNAIQEMVPDTFLLSHLFTFTFLLFQTLSKMPA